MPCYKPLEAWRSSEKTPKGKNKIVFNKSGTSMVPIKLPCGQCIGCRLTRSLEWAIRVTHETQLNPQNCFITLTYNDDNLPSDGSLIPWHFTDFMKRLRFRFKNHKVRYYMCGEYGEKLSRPHYHACLLGIDFPDKEVYTEKEGIITYTSQILEDLWGYGFTTTGELNFDTAAYTARYITKKITGEQAQDHYQTTCQHTGNLIQLEPEYCRMSLKPGIGLPFVKQYATDLWPGDFVVYKNRKYSVPRYYDKQLMDEAYDHFKIKRREKANLRKENNTPERLAVREKIQHLRMKQLPRNLES